MAKFEDVWALSLGVIAVASKALRRKPQIPPAGPLADGISVLIPSREGRHLIERMLPGVEADLAPGEIIVVDNGSSDGTADFLRLAHPQVRCHPHPEPLSFARAANRGAALARCRRVCLLNNDMEI